MSSLAPLTPVVGPVGSTSSTTGAPVDQRQEPRPVETAARVADAATLPPDKARQSVKAAAEQIESFLRHVNTNLEFRVDEAAGQVVVSVREQATGKLIRQIPSEEALRLAERLAVRGTTALFDQET